MAEGHGAQRHLLGMLTGYLRNAVVPPQGREAFGGPIPIGAVDGLPTNELRIVAACNKRTVAAYRSRMPGALVFLGIDRHAGDLVLDAHSLNIGHGEVLGAAAWSNCRRRRRRWPGRRDDTVPSGAAPPRRFAEGPRISEALLCELGDPTSALRKLLARLERGRSAGWRCRSWGCRSWGFRPRGRLLGSQVLSDSGKALAHPGEGGRCGRVATKGYGGITSLVPGVLEAGQAKEVQRRLVAPHLGCEARVGQPQSSYALVFRACRDAAQNGGERIHAGAQRFAGQRQKPG
mmetsp:Transcript_71853/g.145784  ORF Transcript_71853/g.145784 Transcript_71853/m.145784 type:complete len:290 (+) Transcript_71853:313-1182(+)